MANGRSDQRLGERVRQYRTEHKLSQAAFGKLVGVTGAPISALENGKKLSNHLRLAVERLIAQDTAPAPESGDENIAPVLKALVETGEAVTLRDLQYVLDAKRKVEQIGVPFSPEMAPLILRKKKG